MEIKKIATVVAAATVAGALAFTAIATANAQTPGETDTGSPTAPAGETPAGEASPTTDPAAAPTVDPAAPPATGQGTDSSGSSAAYLAIAAGLGLAGVTLAAAGARRVRSEH
jgi:hypothetical protein